MNLRTFERGPDRWEIDQIEQRVVARRFSGEALAEDASSTHASAIRAKWEADRLCGRLLAQGFARTSADHAALGKAELEDALRENPDDLETYLVYADWLSERGDDWGQLIAVQHAQRMLPRFGQAQRRDELSRTETVLRFQLAARLWGRLGETIYDESTSKYWCDLIDATWDCGFLRKIEIRYPDEDDVLPPLIEQLHPLPIARLLREIVLVDDDLPVAAIDALATREWPLLRRLVLCGPFDAPRLLPLFAGAPQLETLTLEACAFSPEDVDAYARLQVPSLRKLDITGDVPDDAYAKLRHLAPNVRVIPDA